MPPPQLETVSISCEDKIAIITYSRPKVGNAVNLQTMLDLLEAFRWAETSKDVMVIVLTGEGKFFTCGMDLVTVPSEGPVLPESAIQTLRDLHILLIKCEKVLIAAVNGPAVGYGTSSIALFDLVYSVPDAFFFTPFVKWGLAAEACASVSLSRIMGRQKASALILAQDRMTAQELENSGLITKILPKETFMQEVLTIAHRITALPPGAVQLNKQLMMGPIRDELLAANERECDGLRQRSMTNEPRKAILNFEEEQITRRKSRQSKL